MKRNLLWIIISIAVIMVAGLYWLFFLLGKGTTLLSIFGTGLDRRGGTHLVLQVVTDDAVGQELAQDAERVADELRSRGIAFTGSKKGNDYSVDVSGVDSARDHDVRSLYDQLYQGKYAVTGTVTEGKTDYSLSLLPVYVREMRESTVKQTLETIRRRLDALGISRPTVQIGGGSTKDIQDQLVVELPRLDDPERVIDMITNVAKLELKLVKQEAGGPFSSIDSAVQANGGHIPEGYMILLSRADHSEENTAEYLVVRAASAITGKDLKNARRSTDANGRPSVSFFLTKEGAERFSRITEQHVGERLAIVLNNTIYSAPVIQGRIDAEGVISGRFTIQEAEDLALLLRSGALPASLKVQEVRRIGAPQGNDSARPDKK
jgi:preprotein translocase subunit SecD